MLHLSALKQRWRKRRGIMRSHAFVSTSLVPIVELILERSHLMFFACSISEITAAAALAGSGAWVIGRPTTMWVAPLVIAWAGVATRCWSLLSAPAGRTPGVTMAKPSPRDFLTIRDSRGEVTIPWQPALCARAAIRKTWSDTRPET